MIDTNKQDFMRRVTIIQHRDGPAIVFRTTVFRCLWYIYLASAWELSPSSSLAAAVSAAELPPHSLLVDPITTIFSTHRNRHHGSVERPEIYSRLPGCFRPLGYVGRPGRLLPSGHICRHHCVCTELRKAKAHTLLCRWAKALDKVSISRPLSARDAFPHLTARP